MLFSSFSWMRRFAPGFDIFSVSLLIMFPLAACGGSSSSSTSSTSTGPVNLTYWCWIPGMDKQVALFNQAHPNIHVTVQNVGSGSVEYDKLFTAIKANNEPDVAEVEFQTLPQFETTGSLVDIFQKYNLPVPTTWAQYADDAAKLHAADPKVYIGHFNPRQPGQFVGFIWQNGGQLFSVSGQSWKVSINSPQALQVASYWQDLIDKKLVKVEPDFTNAWYNDLQTCTLATWVSAAWGNGILKQNAPQTTGKWRVAPLPQWQAGQNVSSNWGGSTTVVFKSTKHPQEASTFA